MNRHRRFAHRCLVAPAVIAGCAQLAHAVASWPGYAHDAQHTAISPVAAQALEGIRWTTPVDLNPQYSGGGSLLAHYGSALFTPANTAIVPVKTGASGGFKVEGRSGATGTLLWSQTSDYLLPTHNWVPPFAPALTPDNRVFFPAAGGRVTYRSAIDSATTVSTGNIAFFGDANYSSNPSGYNNSVFINTPITSDASGNLYFGYSVQGSSPLPALGTGGIARISSTGVASFTTAAAAANNAAFTRPVLNCAPALSNDGSTLYIALANSGNTGNLVAVNASTLAPIARTALQDPLTPANAALTYTDGTSSPTVGPDGTVFYGVLESPLGSHNYRGWMLQFDSALAANGQKPGSFGWDITPSIIPATMIPTYTGTSSYLLMTKYNNYKETGGDGVNKLAILDPNASQVDSISGNLVMKEVATIAGVTPDPTLPMVREWCINTTAVDPATNSVLANNEDGKLYRWKFSATGNTFSESIVLTAGIGEAYTPTAIGPDGTVYAVNNATLFAVGTSVSTWNRNDSVSTWSTPSSWTGAVPSGIGATATFSAVINAARTVNVDSPRTVGTMNFDNANSYTVAGSAITLDTATGFSPWVTVVTGSHNITAPLILNDDTTFNTIPIAGGLTITDLTATGRALTKYGEGTLEMNRVRANSLALNVGKVKITPSADPTNASSNASVSRLPTFSIAPGAQLDLTNSKLVTQVAPSAVRTLIVSGRNGGAWNGSGIITSQSSAAGSNFTTLGVSSAADAIPATATATALWAGQTVTGTDTLVMYTYGGDANLDGKLNIDDYVRIDLGIAAGYTGWSNGDFNYDGKINIDDYTMVIDSNIGIQGAPFATAGGADELTAVPEPGGIALLGMIPLLFRQTSRRRRQ